MSHRIVAAVLVATACGGGGEQPAAPPPPPPPAPVATVSITPASVTLRPGATAQLSAATLDAAGAPLSGRTVTWRSGTPDVATVGSTGLVTAVAVGTTQITAESESRTGTATVIVQAAVARVAMDTTAASLVPGQTLQLQAVGLSAAGDSLKDRTTTWTTDAAAVATISASGLLTAVAPGSVVATATIEGQTATRRITVRDGGVVSGLGPTVITAAGGDVRLEVPVGAAPAGLTISVAPETNLPAALPERTWNLGQTLYKLGPDGTQFASPVKVTLKYNPARLPAWVLPGDMGIQRWDGTRWHALANVTVDTVNKTVSGTTTGFSTFGFIGQLPPAVITPTPGSVNYNQRFVDFTARVPGHPDSLFQFAWTTTGSNGSIITSSGNTAQYFSANPILPGGVLDLVFVDVSAPILRGGPILPLLQATTQVDAKLTLTYELQPGSQKIGFGATANFQAIVRKPDGTPYQSTDLFYEYVYTTNAGDLDQPQNTRVSSDRPVYTAWPAKRQVKTPPRGEKVTAKFIMREWDYVGLTRTVRGFRQIGSADAFLEIGENTHVGRFQVVTVPSGSGGCVSANVYAPKVTPTPSSYTMTVKSINDPGGVGTQFVKTFAGPTTSGPFQVVDSGSEYRITLASGCAQTQSAVVFRQNLYATNFGNADVEVVVVP